MEDKNTNVIEPPKIADNKLIFSIVTFSRIFVGVLFIISGLIKANDTIGFAYKLEEYFEVFAEDLAFSNVLVDCMHFFKSIAWEQAFFICVLEVMLGVTLLIGSFKKITVWLLLILILLFTALTWYSWTFEKVTDCGCFGDALKLTPQGSFIKDIILLFFILILFFGQKWIRPLFSFNFMNAILLVALIASIAFPYLTTQHLPVKDFRPYAIGNNLIEKMYDDVPDDIELKYIYKNKKTKITKTFTSIELKAILEDKNWEFVERKEHVIKKGKVAGVHDINMVNVKTGRDVTNQTLMNPNYTAFIVMYDLDKTNKDVQPELNKLASALQKNNINVMALSGATPENVEKFKKQHASPFDFYTVDATALKTIVRSNPGLVLIKNGVVIDNWHFNDFPTAAKIISKYKPTQEPLPLVFMEEIPQIAQNERSNVLATYKERVQTPQFEILDLDGADYSNEFLRDSTYSLLLVHPDYFTEPLNSIDSLATNFVNYGLYVAVLTDDANKKMVEATNNYLIDSGILNGFVNAKAKAVLMKNGKVIEIFNTLPLFNILKVKYKLTPVE